MEKGHMLAHCAPFAMATSSAQYRSIVSYGFSNGSQVHLQALYDAECLADISHQRRSRMGSSPPAKALSFANIATRQECEGYDFRAGCAAGFRIALDHLVGDVAMFVGKHPLELQSFTYWDRIFPCVSRPNDDGSDENLVDIEQRRVR